MMRQRIQEGYPRVGMTFVRNSYKTVVHCLMQQVFIQVLLEEWINCLALRHPVKGEKVLNTLRMLYI